MIDINVIAKNLVKEAVDSTVASQVKKEGRPASQTNLTFDGSVGSNADQNFLRYKRILFKKDQELDSLGQQIASITSNMDDASIDNAVQNPESDLYKITQQYEETEKYISSLEAIMKKYVKEYQANGGVYDPNTDSLSGGFVSDETRRELKNFDQNEMSRYNTDVYQGALNKLKSKLAAYGVNSPNDLGLDSINPNDPKMQKWAAGTEQTR